MRKGQKNGFLSGIIIHTLLISIAFMGVLVFFLFELGLRDIAISSFLPKEEIRNGRAIEIINEVKTKTKIDSEIKLFTTFAGLRLQGVAIIVKAETLSVLQETNVKKNSYSIVTSKFILQKLPDDALLGLVAHEVCHLVAKHLDERKGTEIILKETEADACALVLVGEGPLKSSLLQSFTSADVEERLNKARNYQVAVKTKFLSHIN